MTEWGLQLEGVEAVAEEHQGEIRSDQTRQHWPLVLLSRQELFLQQQQYLEMRSQHCLWWMWEVLRQRSRW